MTASSTDTAVAPEPCGSRLADDEVIRSKSILPACVALKGLIAACPCGAIQVGAALAAMDRASGPETIPHERLTKLHHGFTVPSLPRFSRLIG